MSELPGEQTVSTPAHPASNGTLDHGAANLESTKKGLPTWVVLVVLAACFGAVYVAYSQGLKEPPPHLIKGKGA